MGCAENPQTPEARQRQISRAGKTHENLPRADEAREGEHEAKAGDGYPAVAPAGTERGVEPRGEIVDDDAADEIKRDLAGESFPFAILRYASVPRCLRGSNGFLKFIRVSSCLFAVELYFSVLGAKSKFYGTLV
jgi:hypothetical protein